MKPAPLPAPIEATLNLVHAVAVELFDVTQTCLQSQQFTADDWELLRLTLAHASVALTSPAIAPANQPGK